MKSKTTSGGISIGMVLFLIFLVLKLAEIGAVANWSWWWVTAPLWIPLFFGLLLLIIGAILTASSR